MGNFFGDGKGGPGVGPNALDPLDLRKSGATAAAQDAARLQSQAAQAGIDEQRRQFDTTTGNLSPFLQAGMSVLPDLIKGSTAGGLDERLKSILGGDSFKALLGERTQAAGNWAGQAGLMRSGAGLRQAAAIPTDLAMQIEQMLQGRQSSLVGSAQNAAAGLGGFGAQQADSVTELLRRQGDAWATNSISQGQIAAGRSQGAVGIASMFFSDPRLKENMEPIGKIGPLTLYEWDWIPNVRGVMGCEMNIGFDADEVQKHFPQHVVETTAGFLAIDYHALTDELKERLQ
jgi:hypothetical protein